MIFYFDIRRFPIFRTMFKRSGVIQKDHFRSIATYFFSSRGSLSKYLPGLSYSRPKFRDGDDKIIVFDSYSTARHLKWLQTHWPGKRVILWYWNSVISEKLIRDLPEGVELWTYSRRDAEKYGMRLNTQFFFDCLAEEAEICRRKPLSSSPKALFFGRDKGRSGQIMETGEALREAGVEVDIRIVPNTAPGLPSLLNPDIVPYQAVVDMVKDADILIDYCLDPDSGLSLRAMESMFFGKKLVTNNKTVLDSDFYNPANIYVLGHDNRSLKEFVDCRRELVSPEIRDRYLLSNWLKRFDL